MYVAYAVFMCDSNIREAAFYLLLRPVHQIDMIKGLTVLHVSVFMTLAKTVCNGNESTIVLCDFA